MNGAASDTAGPAGAGHDPTPGAFPGQPAHSPATGPPHAADNPYPGLRKFEPEDSALYFGRDEEIDELLARLQRSQFLAVVGTSGSGKSSLVRAGLIPALRAGSLVTAGTFWRIVVSQPGGDPIGNLAASLAADIAKADRHRPETHSPAASDTAPEPVTTEVVCEALGTSSMGLVEVARRWIVDGQNRLLVIIDQFEELFRFARQPARGHAADEAKAFVNLLLAATGQEGVGIFVVLTMRSEFLGASAQFRDLPAALNESQFLVPRMTRPQLKEAIEGPAGVRGVRVASTLMQRLLNDVADHADQLPVLQHALMRMWDYSAIDREGGKYIDLTHYQLAGGSLQEALDQHASQILAELQTASLKDLTRRVFQQLVVRDAKGEIVRRPLPRGELQTATAADARELDSVIEAYSRPGRTFLLIWPGDIVDISHESLIKIWRVFAIWIMREERSADVYRRLADAARRRFHLISLYVGAELSEALDWQRNERPTRGWAEQYDKGFAPALRFLKWSRIRRNALRAVAGVALIVAIAWVPVRQELKLRAIRAEARNVAAQVFAADRPEGHLRDALRSTIRNYAQLETFDDAGRIKDALQLATNAAALDGRELGRVDRFRDRHLTDVAFSSDGACIATWGYQTGLGENGVLGLGGGSVTLWNAPELSIVAVQWVPPLDVGQSVSIGGRSTDGPKDVGRLLALLTPPGLVQTAAPVSGIGTCGGNAVSKEAIGEKRFEPVAAVKTPGIVAVTLDEDRHLAASAGWDGTVVVWNLADRTALHVVDTGGKQAWDVAFDPNGSRLATAHVDGALKLWDVKSGKLLQSLNASGKAVRRLAFRPDGLAIATAHWDNIVRLWDLRAGTRLELKGHTRPVNAVAFDASGQRLVSGASDGFVRIWNARTGARVHEIATRGQSVRDVAFSPDGTLVASASVDGAARIWDVATKQNIATMTGHTGAVWSVAFNRTGTFVVTAGEDGSVRVWEVRTGRMVATLPIGGAGVNDAVFTASGDQIVTASDDDTGRWWNWRDGREAFRILGHPDMRPVTALAIDSRGSIVTVDGTGRIDVVDAASGKITKTFASGQPTVKQLRFSPDETELATVGADGTIKLWRTRDWQPVRSLSHPGVTAPASVSYSQDGSRIAAAGGGATVVWNRSTGALIGRMNGSAPAAADVALSPGGGLVATTDVKGAVRVWNVQTANPVLLVPGQYRWLSFVSDPEPAEDPSGDAKGTGTSEKAARPEDRAALLIVQRDGFRARYPTRNFYEPDIAKLIGRGFREVPDRTDLEFAISLALEGKVDQAIATVEQFAPGSDERRQADQLGILERLRARNFTPLDLQRYFTP